MGRQIQIDYGDLLSFVQENELAAKEEEALKALQTLEEGTGSGAEYRGWLHYPQSLSRETLQQIESIAEEVRSEAEALVVIGIGGSYLGARAVIECLGHQFSALLPPEKRPGPLVFYAGQNLSAGYLEELFQALEGRNFYVNVISKSGTTTEPGLSFRLFRKLLIERYGPEEASRRIISTTDASSGALRKLSEEEGYRSFVIPDDIGGRFSVLTPVGLFPIAVAGISIQELLEGARSIMTPCRKTSLFKNPAAFYACARNLLLQKGYQSEILISYNPKLHYFAEWWKQLYGESEGKEGKGLFPASVLFTTDLHSLGQWIQEGPRTIFETIIQLGEEAGTLQVPVDAAGLEDGLGYLEGRSWPAIQEMACVGTKMAHLQGQVPILTLKVPALEAFYLGQMIQFFETACGISGYLLGVNPFNQPGVEAYKQNMFALLGKPGYEEKTAMLKVSTKGPQEDKIV